MRPPSYPLSWHPIAPESEIPLENKRIVRAFKVQHTKDSLGFSVVEKRDKLKEEFKGLSGPELQQASLRGEKLVNTCEHIIWSYSGDAFRLPPESIANADWFFCDTTFLNQNDRDDKTHASLDEAISISKEAKVKHLVGMHISPRYHRKDIEAAQNKLNEALPSSTLVDPNKAIKVEKEMFQGKLPNIS